MIQLYDHYNAYTGNSTDTTSGYSGALAQAVKESDDSHQMLRIQVAQVVQVTVFVR